MTRTFSRTLTAAACTLALSAAAMAQTEAPRTADTTVDVQSTADTSTSFGTSINVSGPITSQTIQVTAKVKDFRSNAVSIFLAVMLPDGTFFFLDEKKNWIPFTGCPSAAAYYSGTETANVEIPVVGSPTNLSGLRGTQIYAGYGVGQTTAAACEDLLSNSARYRLVWSVGGVFR